MSPVPKADDTVNAGAENPGNTVTSPTEETTNDSNASSGKKTCT
jgi:hypothetical protein